jgi:hypothetical protein
LSLDAEQVSSYAGGAEWAGSDLALRGGAVATDEVSATGGRLQRWVERFKNHPVPYSIGIVLAAGAAVSTAINLFSDTRDVVSNIQHPHAAEYGALATLDLDSRLEFFEENFGTAKSVFDLCADTGVRCPQPAPSTLRVYVHETDDLVIRAVFDGERLAAYAVTLMSPELSPPMQWLDYDLGDLGEVTFDQALDAVETPVEPTDVAIFMGPQSSAYAEVVAVGGAGRYRGLLLGWAPDGWGGRDLAFDIDSARDLDASLLRDEPPDPVVVDRFRSGSNPNTFGEFRDDGYVGNVMHESKNAISLLYLGTEL